jgi:hypothetical protein
MEKALMCALLPATQAASAAFAAALQDLALAPLSEALPLAVKEAARGGGAAAAISSGRRATLERLRADGGAAAVKMALQEVHLRRRVSCSNALL